MTPRVIILGAGGHAKVLLDALLKSASIVVEGLTDANPAKWGERLLGKPVLGDDTILEKYDPGSVQLVNGLGGIGPSGKRREIFETYSVLGYSFLRVIHPSAVIGSEVFLDEGVQVMAGAIIQPGCRVHRNAIVNTRASVDHDCTIGAHVHLAPGVTLSGGVMVKEGSHIGTGATVIQGICIGSNSRVAAGAVVVRDVADGEKVAGVPARKTG